MRLPTMALAPTLSRYEIVGRLATGGMAEVWLARAKGIAGFEKLVVLKTILPHLAEDARFVQMFVNEARLAALLGHPNCVQIFDLGQEDSILFIAMEFIDGFSLTRLLTRSRERNVPVPPQVLVRIIMDACSGLDYAHQLTDREGHPLHLVHRDVSPDNLIVSFAGHTKVVDFGVAKAASAAQLALSTAGQVKGKHGFIAPEYLLGQPIDGRADVFALGVTLYRALTRKKPFLGETDAQVSMAVLGATPRAPIEHVPTIPPPLSEVVMRALEKDPAQRFSSARALRQALEDAVGRVASVEAVADYVNALWPPSDREREALHSFSGAPSIEQASGPALSVVHSGDFEAVSSGSSSNPIMGVLLATDAGEAGPPAPAGSASGLVAAHVPLPSSTEVLPSPKRQFSAAAPAPAVPKPAPGPRFDAATAPPAGPVFFEPTPEFDEAPSRAPWVMLVAVLLALAAAGAWYVLLGPGRAATPAPVRAPAPAPTAAPVAPPEAAPVPTAEPASPGGP